MSNHSTTNEEEKQLTVTDPANTQHLPPAERPVIVFNQLTGDQFDKALALFTPPPRTKATLWKQKPYTKDLIKCAAFCEAVPSMRPTGKLFANISVANNFDNCVIESARDNGDEEMTFSVQEWFSDTLTNNGENPIPDALKNWKPDEPPFELQPEWESGVDWCAKLTKADLEFPGFVELFSSCIDMDEELQREIAKRKHGANATFGTHPSTKMPASRNQAVDFDSFAPSKLIGSQGSALFGVSPNSAQ